MSSEREEAESCNSSMDEAEKEMIAEEEAQARKERRERRERLKQSLAESLRSYEERQLRRSIDSARREAEQVTTPMEGGQEGSPGSDAPVPTPRQRPEIRRRRPQRRLRRRRRQQSRRLRLLSRPCNSLLLLIKLILNCTMRSRYLTLAVVPAALRIEGLTLTVTL
jgi:hypothetical protein